MTFVPCSELARYLNRPLEIVTERCKYAPIELAWKWPEYQHDPLRFYRESDLYLFDLTMYHDMILEPQGLHLWFEHTVQRLGFKKMLDFGGGCGDWTIQAIKGGATDVIYCDVVGVMERYAAWRFADRGEVFRNCVAMNNEWIVSEPESRDNPINAKYDAIICMDVFEHMVDPLPTIKQFAETTPYIFCNPDDVRYGFPYPQHISRFDLTPYFEHVDRYLYKSKGYAG